MADVFWLSDDHWAVVGRFMPSNQLGARRVDDRRVVSGILHILRTGGRWRDVPAKYGPATTVYNRFNRWLRRGFWRAMLAALAEVGWIAQTAAIDSTYTKAHRCAHGGMGGQKPGHRPVAGRADHQGPRPVRHPRPPCRRPSHPGQLERRKDGARCLGGRPGPHPAPSGRQGL